MAGSGARSSVRLPDRKSHKIGVDTGNVTARGRASVDKTGLHFMKGPHRFDIRRQRRSGHAAYVGYVDGRRSITAPRPDIAARTLIQKHIHKVPSADVISFARVRNRFLRS